MLKSRKLRPASWLPSNMLKIAVETSASASEAACASMPSVLTACSFASSALTEATAACQEPKPSGAKINAIASPITFRMLLSKSSATYWKEVLKCMSTHRNTQTIKMIVPALIMKAFALSQT